MKPHTRKQLGELQASSVLCSALGLRDDGTVMNVIEREMPEHRHCVFVASTTTTGVCALAGCRHVSHRMSPAAWIAAFVRSSQTGVLAKFEQMISIGDDGGWSPSSVRMTDHRLTAYVVI